jgi:hypothetical protein
MSRRYAPRSTARELAYFDDGQGAFGCERERRSELFALARERAQRHPPRRRRERAASG